MEQVMNKIDLNNLDKSTWESYTFEEIVFRISETVDPNKTNLPFYIGLEHIDADDIHIRRQGTPDDVNGQKLKCYPGDVIFGKRRAYQRKAAIVDFEGICSAHAFVLRANPEVIDPQLFPFFLHSDQFMHRMVDISVGGLSPTINWGDLKHQEFLLPPKDQQANFAELLWAMDEVIEKEKEAFDKLKVLRNTKEKEIFMSSAFNLDVEAIDFFDKIADGTHDTPTKKNDGYKLLTSKNIKDNLLDFETDYYISKEDYNAVNKRSKVDKNDILFGMIGTVGQVCRIKEEPDYAIKNMGLFKTTDETKSLVGFYYFKSRIFQNKLLSELSGTTQKYVSLSYLRSLKLPNPNNSYILNWIESEVVFEKNLNFLQSKIDSSKNLQKSIINQVF
jgi:type I restriction enzyme S subunit